MEGDGRRAQAAEPFYIKPANEQTFAFAALWGKSITQGGETILSCAVITMPANELLRDIHNSKFRMPAILKHEHIETWLSGTQQEARAALLRGSGFRGGQRRQALSDRTNRDRAAQGAGLRPSHPLRWAAISVA
jgi:putative SOS response-associated peptidase YedK